MASVLVIRSQAEFLVHLKTHKYFAVSRPKKIHPAEVTLSDWVVHPTEDKIWWLFKYESDQLRFFEQYAELIIWRGIWRD